MNDSDYKSVAVECGLFDNISVEVFEDKIRDLSYKYPDYDVIKICNYMLRFCDNPEKMMYLIREIDRYRDVSSLEVLVDILLLKTGAFVNDFDKDKFTSVRVMCAKAIANLKNTSAVSALLYCLNNKNENYRLRLACADALGKIGDRFAVAPLIDVVKDENEKSVYVKESAATALGLLGDSRAIDPLVGILEAKQGLLDKFSFLKERVIEALNKMGISNNEKVFRALKLSLTDSSSQVRINAIEGLMDSNNPAAFELIKKRLMEDDDEEVKKNALIALYNMSDRKILDEVLSSDKYSDSLKIEASKIIDEYEE